MNISPDSNVDFLSKEQHHLEGPDEKQTMLKSEINQLKQTNYKLLEEIEVLAHEEKPENIENLFIQNKNLRSLAREVFNWIDALDFTNSHCQNLEQKCQEMTSEINRLKAFMNEQTNNFKFSHLSAGNSGGNASENQLEILRRKVIELENEKENLHRDLDFWKEKFEKDAQLRFKLQTMEDQVKILEAERENLDPARDSAAARRLSEGSNEYNSRFSTQFSDNITLNPDVFERLNELEKLKKENAELQQRAQQFEEATIQWKNCSEERALLLRQLQETNEETEELEEKLAANELESSGIVDWKDKVASLTAELESIRDLLNDNEILKLLPEEDVRRERMIWEDVQNRDGMKGLSYVRKKVIELIAANKCLAETVKTQEREAEGLVRPSAAFISEKSELECTVVRLSEELHDKCKDIDELEGKIASYEASLRQLDEENRTATIELRKMMAADDYEKELIKRSENAQLKIRDYRITELEKDKHQLYVENDQLKRELIRLKAHEAKTIQELEAPTVSLSEELAKLISILKDKDSDLKRLKNQLEEQQSHIKPSMIELKQELSRLEGENERMNALLLEKDAELNLLRRKTTSSMEIKAKIEEILTERTSLMEERDLLAGQVYETHVELENLKRSLQKAEEIYRDNQKIEGLLSERTQKLDELSLKFKGLESKCVEREEEIRSLIEEREGLCQKIESLSQSKEGYRLDIAQLQGEINQMKKKIEYKDAEFHEVSEKLQHLDKEHSSLLKEHDGMLGEFEEMKKYIEHLNVEEEDLIKVLKEKDARITFMGEELGKLEHSLNSRIVEYDSLKGQLDGLVFENARLEEIVEFRNKRLNEMNIELEDQKEREASFAQTLNSEINNLATRIEVLSHERTTLTNDRDNLMKSIASKDSQISHMALSFNKMRQNLSSANSELEQSKATILEFEQNIRDLEEPLNASEQDMQAFKDSIAKLEDLRLEFAESRSLLQQVSAQRDELLKDLEERNLQLVAQNKDIESFWSNMHAQNAVIEDLKSQKQALEGNIEMLQREAGQRDQTIENLTNRLNEINSSLTGTVHKLIEEKDSIVAQLNKLNLDKQQLFQQRESLKNIVLEKDTHIAELMKAVRSLEENLSARNAELIQERDERISMLTEDLNQVMMQLATRKSDAEPLSNQIDTLRQQVELLTTNNTELNRAIALKNEEITSLNGELSRREYEFATKATDIEILKEQLDKFTAENTKLREIVENSTQYIDTLNQKQVEPALTVVQSEPILEAVKEELNNMVLEQGSTLEAWPQNADQGLSLEESLAKLRFELANKATDCEILRDQVSKLAAENAKLREVVENATKCIDNLQQEQPLVAEQEVLIASNQESQQEPRFVENSQLLSLKENIVQLEKDLETFASGIHKNSEMILSIGEKMENLQKTIFERGRENYELNMHVIEFESLKESVDSCQQALVYITVEKDNLIANPAVESTEVPALLERFIVLDGSLQSKAAENIQISTRLKKLSISVDMLQQEFDNAMSFNNSNIKASPVVEASVSELVYHHKDTQTELSGQNESLLIQNQQLKDDLDRLVIEKDSLIELLGHKIHEFVTLETSFNAMSDENKRLVQDITDLGQKLERAVAALQKDNTDIGGFKGLLDYASDEVETLKEKVTNLEVQNEKLRLAQKDNENELNLLRRPLQDLGGLESTIKEAELSRSQIKERPETLDRLRESLFNLQQDLLRVINDRDNLHKVLKMKESELESVKPIIPFYETLIYCLKTAEQEISRLTTIISQQESEIQALELRNKNVEGLNQFSVLAEGNMKKLFEENSVLRGQIQEFIRVFADLEKRCRLFDVSDQSSILPEGNTKKLAEENTVLKGQVQEFIQIVAELENRYRALEKSAIDMIATSKGVKKEQEELIIPSYHTKQADQHIHSDKKAAYDVSTSTVGQKTRSYGSANIQPPQRF